jgi:hypothetical protein
MDGLLDGSNQIEATRTHWQEVQSLVRGNRGSAFEQSAGFEIQRATNHIVSSKSTFEGR